MRPSCTVGVISFLVIFVHVSELQNVKGEALSRWRAASSGLSKAKGGYGVEARTNAPLRINIVEAPEPLVIIRVTHREKLSGGVSSKGKHALSRV